MGRIADCISLRRRYSRSVNLERDRNIAEAVLGYVLTPRALEALRRFLESVSRATQSGLGRLPECMEPASQHLRIF